MPPARIKTFDQIKGLVMILTLLGHGVDFIYDYGISDNNIYSIVRKIIQLFHMPLMFCVSGYLAGFNKKSKVQSFIKDFISLYIPYLLLVYLFLLERIVGKYFFGIVGETPIDLSVSGILKRLIHADGIAWFVLSLFVIKTIINLIKDYANIFLLVIISILFVVLIYHFSPENVYLVRYMPSYVMGYIFNRYDYAKSKILSVISLVLLFFLFVYAAIYSNNLLIANIAGVLIFYLQIQYPWVLPKGKLIEIMGKDSMVVYFIDGLTNFTLIFLLSKLFNSAIIILCLYMMIAIILFYFICFLYRNIKVFTWIEYIFYPYRLYLKLKSNN